MIPASCRLQKPAKASRQFPILPVHPWDFYLPQKAQRKDLFSHLIRASLRFSVEKRSRYWHKEPASVVVGPQPPLPVWLRVPEIFSMLSRKEAESQNKSRKSASLRFSVQRIPLSTPASAESNARPWDFCSACAVIYYGVGWVKMRVPGNFSMQSRKEILEMRVPEIFSPQKSRSIRSNREALVTGASLKFFALPRPIKTFIFNHSVGAGGSDTRVPETLVILRWRIILIWSGPDVLIKSVCNCTFVDCVLWKRTFRTNWKVDTKNWK